MIELCLLRHAETTANADGTLQGRLSYPLSARGEAQAQRLVERLCAVRCDVVIRSPSARVLRTLAPALDAGLREPMVMDELDEIDLGEAAGLSFAEFVRRYRSTLDEQAYARGEYRFPGGESRRDLYERAAVAWARIEGLGAERVLVASHGGLLSQLLAVILDIPNDGRVRFRLDNAAISELCWFRSKPFVSRFNDREHLPPQLRSPVFAPQIFSAPAGVKPSAAGSS